MWLQSNGTYSDGLSTNRRLFQISSSETAGIPYKVLNPYSDNGRYIYFFSDPPHLMKTTRNAWASEKRSLWVSYTPSQGCLFLVIMQCNGSSIPWDHLHQLYVRNRSEAGLSLISKLKYKHIHLTTLSKMRVDLATQVWYIIIN